MLVKYKKMIYGAATYLPGINSYLAKRNKGQGGTLSSRYCYSVWLRHLVMAKQSGLDLKPEVVAELGPGKSLGVGLAALICGAEKYLAFDLVEQAEVIKNLEVFNELVYLFKNKTPIPGQDEFPIETAAGK